jgi:hypothetical protein
MSGMGGPTSSYATAGITLRVSGALKPHHHDKEETLSVGYLATNRRNIIYALSYPLISLHCHKINQNLE